MKSFYIDPNTNDICLDGQNNLKMVEGDDELAQCVGLTFKTNKGEWFLNPEHGFKRSVVQTKNYDQNEVYDELYEAALQEDRVNAIDEVNFDYDQTTRKLKIDFKFKKQDGSLVEGVVK